MNKQKFEISLKNEFEEENDNLIDNKNGNLIDALQNNNINESISSKDLNQEIKNEKNIFLNCLNSYFINYFFVITFLFSIIMTIVYIIFYKRHKPNFQIFHYDWDASYLNDRKYENYIFDNGLEVMLIQDQAFDRDGGAIVIEKGYLDNTSEEGISSIATHLLSKIAFNNEIIMDTLNDYYGKYNYDTDEYYINFRFDILNDGFKKFMYYFSLILNPQNLSNYYDNFIEDIILKLDNNYISKMSSSFDREYHLLNYFVYGLKDNNSNEILPEGNRETIEKYEKNELKKKVLDYIEELIDPTKIKIVFFSKYKFLISANYMKNYFSYLTNMEKPKNSKFKEKIYENQKVSASQIIFTNEDYYYNNYIHIYYYIEKINNESYTELFYKSKYLNYIIDFLNEKKEGSLFYLLTNSSNHNIKSIESGYDIIMKSKIEFSISIELNCLENINNIIFLTYQFVDKIINEATNTTLQMERYKELKTKYYQDVKYVDKSFNTIELARANALQLFKSRYNLKYFLYVQHIPWDDNEESLKNESSYYFKQIKPENSIVIIGIRDKDKNKLTCNDSSPFYINCSYFKDENNINYTHYYNVKYIKDIFRFNYSDMNIDNQANITFRKNNYMTTHNKPCILKKEKNIIESLESKSIFNKFYLKEM